MTRFTPGTLIRNKWATRTSSSPNFEILLVVAVTATFDCYPMVTCLNRDGVLMRLVMKDEASSDWKVIPW